MGCDFGQGYVFSPAVKADALMEWMRARTTSTVAAAI